jgi:hypothetical protein
MKALVGLVILWYGVVFGNLDWLSDLIYAANADFYGTGLKNACAAFCVIQPIFYIFLFSIYVASSS